MDIPSIDYILDEAAKNNMAIWQVVLKEEQAESGMSEEDIRARLEESYQVMKNAAMGGISSEVKSISGLTGGDAAKPDGFSGSQGYELFSGHIGV